MKKQKIIVVAGPTATGKTKLGVALAKKFGGEVISADSMQIYRQLDIITAKPTLEEMEQIPHHLVNFLDVNKLFSVADFVKLAQEKIQEIGNRGNVPILVGGTGLYINSLVNHVDFTKVTEDVNLRRHYTQMGQRYTKEFLHNLLRIKDPETAEKVHFNNAIRVVRALEVLGVTGIKMSQHQKNAVRKESPYEPLFLGLQFRDRDLLYHRMDHRIDLMMRAGLLGEAQDVFLRKDINETAKQAIGYKEFYGYFKGEISLETAIETIKSNTRHYGKRQLTWFRRNKEMHWLFLDDYTDFVGLTQEACKISKTFLEGVV